MKKHIILLSIYLFAFTTINLAQNNNGIIDNLNELYQVDTVFVKTKDNTKLSTNIYLPIIQDCVITNVVLNNDTFPIQIIPKNTQYVIFDTLSPLTANNYKLPIILTRTPYNKNGSGNGGDLLPLLGYCYAIQDMRGRYESEGVYFPMISDAWPKNNYVSTPIPLDLYPTNSLSNALYHSDGSESIFYINDSLYRNYDINKDNIVETFTYSNGNIGMFGASALGNTQYQAMSNIPFSTSHPIKCLMPIVATNEHYNTTLFNNGVFRYSLVTGWITGQMFSGVIDSLNVYDSSLNNNIHSPSDYGYVSVANTTEDLLKWYVEDKIAGNPSGAYPNSPNRRMMDASQVPVDNSGLNSASGTVSRYKNLNTNIYHLTGWWDIFIDGQIETFNKTREANPQTLQKIIIGPWTHQTIGTDSIGVLTFPENVLDVTGYNLDSYNNTFLSDSTFFNELYNSEMLGWFRTNLGGEPYFIIPESQVWQSFGTYQIRIPSKNYIIPYYQFLNYIGGQDALYDVPIELNTGSNITSLTYDIPIQDSGLVALSTPLTPSNHNFNSKKDIRVYMPGPINDTNNPNIGNYWVGLDSFPDFNNTYYQTYYLHQNNLIDTIPIVATEGTLSYINDPDNPVITLGGNNMLVRTPVTNKLSQGPMNLADSTYVNYTMNRSDVLSFETTPLSDTMSILGFPKARIYAKCNSNLGLTETNFDIFIRVLDVYPDGREIFVTEGSVNARAINYAKSLYDDNENISATFQNPLDGQYYYLQFKMLPIGYVFGENHKIKILISSSNYPKYQSNPQIPLEAETFFRWSPGDSSGYVYQGNLLYATPATITLSFYSQQPNTIELPTVKNYPLNTSLISEKTSLNRVILYPNPAHNYFSLHFSSNISSKINLYNLSGQLISTYNINNSNHKRINTQNIAKGIYIINIPTLNTNKLLSIE